MTEDVTGILHHSSHLLLEKIPFTGIIPGQDGTQTLYNYIYTVYDTYISFFNSIYSALCIYIHII